MANYIKSTDFAAKDRLTKGDPSKKIVGAEIDNEFNSLQESSRTKLDKVLGAAQGNLPLLTSQGDLVDSGKSITTVINDSVPIAVVLPFVGTIGVPSGFLLCDGREISRNDYSELFLRIGTTFGGGNGTTTFNIPDVSGRTILGSGSDWTVGATGGVSSQTLSEEHIAPHEHPMFSDQDLSGIVTTVTGTGNNPPTPGKSPGPITSNDYVARSGLWTHTEYAYDSIGGWVPLSRGKTYETYDTIPTSKEASVGRTGRNRADTAQPFSLMQPYIVMNYIIKY